MRCKDCRFVQIYNDEERWHNDEGECQRGECFAWALSHREIRFIHNLRKDRVCEAYECADEDLDRMYIPPMC